MPKKDPKEAWYRCLERLNRLVESDSPDQVRAHYLVNVVLPKLAKLIGVRTFTAAMAEAMSKGLCGYMGYCSICQKSEVIPGEDLCPLCLAQVDQLEAEIRDTENDTDT